MVMKKIELLQGTLSLQSNFLPFQMMKPMVVCGVATEVAAAASILNTMGVAARSIEDDEEMSDAEEPQYGVVPGLEKLQTRAGTSVGRTRRLWSIIFQEM